MLTISFGEETFCTDSLAKIKRHVHDKYDGVHEAYSKYFYDGRKCAWCGDPIKEDIKYVTTDNVITLVNAYKALACRKVTCASYRVNPMSKDWLMKANGMSEEDAIAKLKCKGQRGSKTTKAKMLSDPNFRPNPYSKNYWLSIGKTEEEAQLLVNSRNRRKKEFWLKRGYEEHNAENMARFHCGTFTKEFLMYFKGFDEKEAEHILKLRGEQAGEKIKLSYTALNALRKGSSAADTLFKSVFAKLSEIGITEDEVYTESFGHKREWYVNDGKQMMFYDFVVPDLGLVVELNGVHVHPKEEHMDNWKHAYDKRSSEEVWARDRYKEKVIKDKFGFDLYFSVFSDEDMELATNDIIRTVNKSLEVY